MAAGVPRNAWSDQVRLRCLQRQITYCPAWAEITTVAAPRREHPRYRRAGSDASQAHPLCPATTSLLVYRLGTTSTNPFFVNGPPLPRNTGQPGVPRRGVSRWASSPGTGTLSSLGKTRHSMSRVRLSRGRDRIARVTAHAQSTQASAASRSLVSHRWT